MPKYMLLLALLGLAVNVSAQPNAGSDQKASGAPEKQQIAIPSTEATNATSNSQGSSQSLNTSKNQTPPWYAPFQKSEWWLVVVATLTGIAIAYQAREMTRATAAMDRQTATATDTLAAIQRQADLMERQLEMAERPWIHVDVGPGGGITYDQLGLNIPVKITLTNLGKTPAQKLDIEPIMYFLGGDRDARKSRDQLIHNMQNTRNMSSITVFPGYPETITMPLLCHDHTRRYETMRSIAGSTGDVICAVAIICLTYRGAFDIPLPYFTGIICNIGEGGEDGHPNILKPGKPVWGPSVLITRQSNHGTVAG